MNFIIGFLDRFADQLEEISKTSQKFHIAAPLSGSVGPASPGRTVTKSVLAIQRKGTLFFMVVRCSHF